MQDVTGIDITLLRTRRVKDFLISVFAQEDPMRRDARGPMTMTEAFEDALGRIDTEFGDDAALQGDLLDDFGEILTSRGDYDRATGVRFGLHWSSIFYGAIPVVCLAFAGKINGQEAGQLLILISGLVYFLAGVHFDRRWMLSGIVMIFGAALLTYVTRYGWTTLGVLLFIALTVGFSRYAAPAGAHDATVSHV